MTVRHAATSIRLDTSGENGLRAQGRQRCSRRSLRVKGEEAVEGFALGMGGLLIVGKTPYSGGIGESSVLDRQRRDDIHDLIAAEPPKGEYLPAPSLTDWCQNADQSGARSSGTKATES